jgi:hypothetical protein
MAKLYCQGSFLKVKLVSDVLMDFVDRLSQECPPNGSFSWSLLNGEQPPWRLPSKEDNTAVSTGGTRERDELKFATQNIYFKNVNKPVKIVQRGLLFYFKFKMPYKPSNISKGLR